MKTVLVAINSQYIHSNLAVRYLKAACGALCGEVRVLEFSINETLGHIFSSILREKPNIVAFSCYIWNIELVVKLAGDLKKALPHSSLIAGGPEVSFDGGGLISGCVDYIISGEGEEKLPFLLTRLNAGALPDDGEMNWLRSYSTIENLDQLKTPYPSIEGVVLKNRIAYIEASRGCPFRCGYCISSITGGVRYFPEEMVYNALEVLVNSGTRIIKFVDRTFNANEQRALQIWNHLLRYEGRGLIFHFEIDPGLLTERLLDCLEKMPPGLIQLEAGIQSIHPETLEAVKRPWQIQKAFKGLRTVISFGNIHVHVDLIAGLPYESYARFKESFNKMMGLYAHHCQLGFLKLLRGSALRDQAGQYGYRYRDYPPYEVISNHELQAEQIIALKDIEACVELFYNSGRFTLTLKAIEQHSDTWNFFDFYESLALFMREKGYLDRPVKAADLYGILLQFAELKFPRLVIQLTNTMRLDYLRSFKNPSIPDCLRSTTDADTNREKQKLMEKYREMMQKTLPRLQSQSLDALWQQVYIGEFTFPPGLEYGDKAVIAVDFGDVSPVTGLAGAYPLIDV